MAGAQFNSTSENHSQRDSRKDSQLQFSSTKISVALVMGNSIENLTRIFEGRGREVRTNVETQKDFLKCYWIAPKATHFMCSLNAARSGLTAFRIINDMGSKCEMGNITASAMQSLNGIMVYVKSGITVNSWSRYGIKTNDLLLWKPLTNKKKINSPFYTVSVPLLLLLIFFCWPISAVSEINAILWRPL